MPDFLSTALYTLLMWPAYSLARRSNACKDLQTAHAEGWRSQPSACPLSHQHKVHVGTLCPHLHNCTWLAAVAKPSHSPGVLEHGSWAMLGHSNHRAAGHTERSSSAVSTTTGQEVKVLVNCWVTCTPAHAVHS